MTAREVPEQTYLSSALIRLVVRFDEFGAKNTPEPPKKPTPIRKGTGSEADLEVKLQDGRLQLLPKAGKTLGGPQKQTVSDDGRTWPLDGIIPAQVRVQRNGIRTADTATVSLKFADLPIDPRVVRACAIEIFIGTMPLDDWSKGIRGATSGDKMGGDFGGEGAPLNTLQETWIDASGQERSNLRFQGWVDEWRVSFPDGDQPMVELECTDNTRLLIDQEIAPKLTVGTGEPLDKAIANYLAAYPQFAGLEVEYRPAGVDPPKLKDALAKTAYQPKLGPAAQGAAGKTNVLDYLTDICGSVGHTIRMLETRIIIQRARTLYSSKMPVRPDDPFTGRVLPSGRELKARTYIYGRNVAELEFSRKFARHAPQNIEVRCYSTKRKKTLVVRYPEKDSRQKKLLPGNSGEQKWTVITVEGIEDEKTLRIVAQGVYETIGRQELMTHLTTKDLGSFGGSNENPDALDVQPGDAIEVLVNRDLDLTTIGGLEEKAATNPEAFLRALGYPTDFAKAYAEAVANVDFPTTFRVKAFTIEWDSEDGPSLDFELINFLEIRAGKEGGAELPAGEEVSPSAAATSKPEIVRVEAN